MQIKIKILFSRRHLALPASYNRALRPDRFCHPIFDPGHNASRYSLFLCQSPSIIIKKTKRDVGVGSSILILQVCSAWTATVNRLASWRKAEEWKRINDSVIYLFMHSLLDNGLFRHGLLRHGLLRHGLLRHGLFHKKISARKRMVLASGRILVKPAYLLNPFTF